MERQNTVTVLTHLRFISTAAYPFSREIDHDFVISRRKSIFATRIKVPEVSGAKFVHRLRCPSDARRFRLYWSLANANRVDWKFHFSFSLFPDPLEGCLFSRSVRRHSDRVGWIIAEERRSFVFWSSLLSRWFVPFLRPSPSQFPPRHGTGLNRFREPSRYSSAFSSRVFRNDYDQSLCCWNPCRFSPPPFFLRCSRASGASRNDNASLHQSSFPVARTRVPSSRRLSPRSPFLSPFYDRQKEQ